MSINLLAALRRVPAIGILRGCPPQHVEEAATAAIEGGFRVLEVTLDSPEPHVSIGRLATLSSDVLVGAGTVRTVEDVGTAVASGAVFLVSPFVDEMVVAEARRLGVPIVPGAATPTEVWRALQAGATGVKVFPAVQLGGPDYLRAIRGPLGDPHLVPTGGVSLGNAKAFLEAGAYAVGVGGSVFPIDALMAGDAGRVRSAAIALIGEIT